LRAIARLKDSGVACRLLIAGDGDYQGRLNELSKTLGIGSNIEFLGFVPESKKLELLRKSWINVLTSSKEGWGITNLEAAACGTPTIASDSPGLRDSVLHESTGFLVDHGNHEALADRMIELFDDVDLRIKMGLKSRAFAKQFSWDKSAMAVEELLRQRVVHSQVNS
jgi:glycosyltransferase involved in cell wall biosynthesis